MDTTATIEAPAPAAPTPPQATIAKRVEQFIKLRDLIKKKEEEQKAALKPAKDTLEQLSEYLLAHLNQNGVDSVAAPSGTVYRSTKKSASLADPEAFMTHVIETQSWDLLVRKAAEGAVEAYIEEHGAAPPGVNFSKAHTIGVRRKTGT
jgi:hypothetical protein